MLAIGRPAMMVGAGAGGKQDTIDGDAAREISLEGMLRLVSHHFPSQSYCVDMQRILAKA